MPPPKNKPTTVENGAGESGGSRVTTRASNANKHPGTEAKLALQVLHRRDPEVIQAEKDKKKEVSEAKKEARQREAAQKETAQRNLEDYRAQQAASLEHDNATFPQQQANKGIFFFPSDPKLTLFSTRWSQETQERCRSIS